MTVEQSWHPVPGGTAWAVLELLRALKARSDVDVVGVAARHRHPAPEPWQPPVEVRHLPFPRRLLYETWHLPVARFPKVERATGSVDVVHATAFAYPASVAPVVVTINDLAFLDDPRLSTRHGLRFFRRGTELARAHARLVVCPSEATRRDCLEFGFDEARLRVVPWAVRPAPPVSAEQVESVRSRHGLRRPYVLFVGTIEPRKNLPALLRAFADLTDLDVDLVLVGPSGWNEDLAPAAARLGERCKQLGFVSRGDLEVLMAGAAAFCYPSLREGFGLPVLEAMAHGTPVVTSRGTSTEEVAGDAAVLVDPFDPASIGEGLRRVLTDGELAAGLRVAGVARAAELSWERTADGYVQIYKEAATRSPTTAVRPL